MTGTNLIPAGESAGRVRFIDFASFNVVLIGVPAILLYFPVVLDMVVTWWTDPGATHGFLIPPLALYTAWKRRGRLAAEPARPSNRGLWLVLSGCAVFLMGVLGAGNFLCRTSLLIVGAGLIWTFWGRKRLRVLAFPLLLLTTMIPPPTLLYDGLSAPLQIFASDVSSNLAQSLGATVYREGNQIYLAHIRLGVAEACSGLHSLSALVIAACLLGAIYCRRLPARALLVLAAFPIAVAANVLRITGTAVLADYRPEWAMGLYHLFTGWLVFLIGFAALGAVAHGMQTLEHWRESHAG